MGVGVVDREAMTAAFDALHAAFDEVAALQLDALTTPELLGCLERCEQLRRRLPAVEHPMINTLARQASKEELGGKLAPALADRLLIRRTEASRRIKEAAELGPRQALTGAALPPLLPATAAAQRDGTLGAGQIKVIRQFCHQLPDWVETATRESAEAQLAELGSLYSPEDLEGLAKYLADAINPDGNFTDKDRVRRRGLTLNRQQTDGMSELHGWLMPETRAGLEAVLAKLAAPGMCNSADETPCVDGTPDQETIDRDTRSTAQRNHDALNAALRAVLASGKLGQHNGLPASIIVTTTLADLEAGAGCALTGGGTMVPMSEVIRLAQHAHNYLAIFDKGKPLALYHTKRLASPAQRIVLYANERGCSAPGCQVPGYLAEVHHVEPFASCRETHIDNLTFACGTHHRLIKPGGWNTRKLKDNRTAWLPPPHLDRGQPRTNHSHHPERMLRSDEVDEEEAC